MESQPCSRTGENSPSAWGRARSMPKILASCERRAVADRCNHRTREIGPMPGTVITLRQPSSLFAKVSISSVTGSIRSSSCRQSLARSATMRTIRGERTSVRLAKMSGSAWRRKRSPCRTMMPRSRRKPRIYSIQARPAPDLHDCQNSTTCGRRYMPPLALKRT